MDQAQFAALPPDIRFDLLPKTADALAFSFMAKEDALGPHIRVRWPWDDAYQRSVHRERFAEKPFFSIRQDNDAIGTLSWMACADHIRFGEFYLLSKYRGRGLGTRILRHALAQADHARLPVHLEYLKWNPVGRLYLRHGFRVSHETDIHFFLRRPAKSKA